MDLNSSDAKEFFAHKMEMVSQMRCNNANQTRRTCLKTEDSIVQQSLPAWGMK